MKGRETTCKTPRKPVDILLHAWHGIFRVSTAGRFASAFAQTLPRIFFLCIGDQDVQLPTGMGLGWIWNFVVDGMGLGYFHGLVHE